MLRCVGIGVKQVCGCEMGIKRDGRERPSARDTDPTLHLISERDDVLCTTLSFLSFS